MKDRTPAAGAAPQENKMGVLPIGKLLAGMAIPMMISMLVQALYNVVDSVFVARLSQDALNAVSLAFPLQNLMIALGGGTAVGIGQTCMPMQERIGIATVSEVRPNPDMSWIAAILGTGLRITRLRGKAWTGEGKPSGEGLPSPLPKPHPLLFKDFRVYRIPVPSVP